MVELILLPPSKYLPVNILAASFNNTTTSYKFYWFISLLKEVELGHSKIHKKDLFARMIAQAWFTVNYFNVSLGKQDVIQKTIYELTAFEMISIDHSVDKVFEQLQSSNADRTQKLLWHFDKNVPHWFLSPWYPQKNKAQIYTLSNSSENLPLYKLDKYYIEVLPPWRDYINDNIKILKDFCFWNLVLYLQSKNPNIPNIPNKLIKPDARLALVNQRKKFWDIVLRELSPLKCIYSGKELTKDNYAIEHFIPFSFVCHDLIWNLIPADKSFNSSKGNKLPLLEKYFEPYFELQKNAFEIIKKVNPKNRFLEDYLTIFPDGNFSKENFLNTVQPLISIASKNGFEFMNNAV